MSSRQPIFIVGFGTCWKSCTLTKIRTAHAKPLYWCPLWLPVTFTSCGLSPKRGRYRMWLVEKKERGKPCTAPNEDTQLPIQPNQDTTSQQEQYLIRIYINNKALTPKRRTPLWCSQGIGNWSMFVQGSARLLIRPHAAIPCLLLASYHF